jgi:hypothetical protein
MLLRRPALHKPKNRNTEHRDTEKNKIAISFRASRIYLFGDREDRRNDVFLLCVLSASVVQLHFPG